MSRRRRNNRRWVSGLLASCCQISGHKNGHSNGNIVPNCAWSVMVEKSFNGLLKIWHKSSEPLWVIDPEERRFRTGFFESEYSVLHEHAPNRQWKVCVLRQASLATSLPFRNSSASCLVMLLVQQRHVNSCSRGQLLGSPRWMLHKDRLLCRWTLPVTQTMHSSFRLNNFGSSLER